MQETAKGRWGYVLVVLIFAGTAAAAVLAEPRGATPATRSEEACAKKKGGIHFSDVALGGVLGVPRRSPGTPWDAPGNVVFKRIALVSLGDAAPPVREVELSLDHNDVYQISWLYRARRVGKPAVVGPSEVVGGGLAIYRVPTGAESVDTVIIAAKSGDGRYAVGHVVPVRP